MLLKLVTGISLATMATGWPVTTFSTSIEPLTLHKREGVTINICKSYPKSDDPNDPNSVGLSWGWGGNLPNNTREYYYENENCNDGGVSFGIVDHVDDEKVPGAIEKAGKQVQGHPYWSYKRIDLCKDDEPCKGMTF